MTSALDKKWRHFNFFQSDRAKDLSATLYNTIKLAATTPICFKNDKFTPNVGVQVSKEHYQTKRRKSSYILC